MQNNNPCANQTTRFDKVRFLVRLFYLCSVTLIFFEIQHLSAHLKLNAPDYLPWLSWLNGTDWKSLVSVLICSWLFLGVLGIFCWWSQIYRSVFFVLLLFVDGFMNSFGKINNGLTAWVYVSFFLALIPTLSIQSRRNRQKTLIIFQAAQAACLLPYTLSSIWKLRAAWQQSFNGEIHAFSAGAFERIITALFLQFHDVSVLGPWFLEHPLISQISFIGSLFIQLGAVFIIWFPRLHVLWGVILILFHLGTMLILNIYFPVPVALLGILLVLSPFSRGWISDLVEGKVTFQIKRPLGLFQKNIK